MGLKPKCAGSRKGIYSRLPPPQSFIAATMDLPVMRATERHREFIAYLAAKRTSLREAQMVRIRRPATANKTGLFHDVPDVVPITNTARFRERENAFIDLRYPGLLADALITNRSVLWMD
jgi:hypothetical protein